MSTEAKKQVVMLYTEQTPNPESLKFVTNRIIYKGTADFQTEDEARKWSPFAEALYQKPFVKSVYISNNYVTVTKEFNYNWQDIMLDLKEWIKSYIQEEKPTMHEGYAEAMEELKAQQIDNIEYSEKDAEIAKKISELIDTYVKPAVEGDGGNIEFKSFINGKVHVIMQGACSGCPSSTVTLKSGIEGMLKRMVPQVEEVVAEMG